MRRAPGVSFLVLGITFLAIAAAGMRHFWGIGVAFLVIGIALAARQRRTGGSK
jgi:hypothetical protein